MRRIDELFMAYPFYGSLQMHAALAFEGMSARWLGGAGRESQPVQLPL